MVVVLKKKDNVVVYKLDSELAIKVVKRNDTLLAYLFKKEFYESDDLKNYKRIADLGDLRELYLNIEAIFQHANEEV